MVNRKAAVAYGLHVMTDGGGEGEEVADAEIVWLAVDGDAYLALEDVDGGGAVGVMLLHAGGVLHGDEDDAEVVLFEESFGGVAGLPGLLLLGVGYLLEQVKLRQFVDHGAVSLRGCHVRRSFVVRKFTPFLG